MRAWFFQGLATSGGVRDWSGFDHALAVAAAHGTRVIVTLAQPMARLRRRRRRSRYVQGRRLVRNRLPASQIPFSGLESYRDWVAEIVAQIQGQPDDPRVAAVIEPEAEVKPTTSATSCSPNAGDPLLTNFATDVSGVDQVDRSEPPRQRSARSVVGSAAPSGPDYQDGARASRRIDLCEYHDYGSPTTAIPGDQFNGLQVRLNQCRALGKPLFVGETGIASSGRGAVDSPTESSRLPDEVRCVSSRAGIVGELVWAWNKDGSAGSYDIGPADPALAVLAQPGASDPTGPLSFSTDKGAFRLDTGPPTSTIDFEDYYPATKLWDASPPGNPVSFVSGGVTFSDPFRVGFGTIDYCDSTGDCANEGTLRLTVPFDQAQNVPPSWPKPMMTLPAGVCGVGLNLVSRGLASENWLTVGATDTTGSVIGPTRFTAPPGPPPSGIGIARWFIGVESANPITQLTFPPGGSWPSVLSVELSGCNAPADASPADGIVDSLQPTGTSPGSFVDSSVTPTTSGAIVDPAGNTVKITDASAPDGVRITVAGSGTAKSVFSACGFGTIQLAPGSDVILSCGSVKLKVIAGSASIVLGGGITVVTLVAGAAAELSDLGAGSFRVATAPGSAPVTVKTNGVTTLVLAGATSTLAVVTAQNICNLTKLDVQSSAKYAALTAKQKQTVDALASAACAVVQSITPKLTAKQKAALVAGYQQALQALAAAGWLTQGQKSTLAALAASL